MWKYLAFVILIICCVPAVLGQSLNTTTVVPPTTSESTKPTTPAPTTAPTTLVQTTVQTTSPTSVPTTAPATVPTTAPATVPTSTEPTTSAATTTVLPPPPVVTYVLTENNKTCIRAELAIRVDIPPSTQYNFINATVNGKCNADNNTQILELTDEIRKTFIILTFAKDSKSYFVQDIQYGLDEEVKGNLPGKFFSTSDGKSYLCNAEKTFSLSDNTTLIFSSVHLQAFGAESFNLAEECDADDKVGDIVPIAVGCALAALVVIVLIAYLVGRRRSRQRGYQSV